MLYNVVLVEHSVIFDDKAHLSDWSQNNNKNSDHVFLACDLLDIAPGAFKAFFI